MSDTSGLLLMSILSPEFFKFLVFTALTCAYIYFVWYKPIRKIRDPETKTKTGWIMLLVFFGILPIISPLIYILYQKRAAAAGANAAAGTSMNASMGPQPVVGMNEMRDALPTNRPAAGY